MVIQLCSTEPFHFDQSQNLESFNVTINIDVSFQTCMMSLGVTVTETNSL